MIKSIEWEKHNTVVIVVHVYEMREYVRRIVYDIIGADIFKKVKIVTLEDAPQQLPGIDPKNIFVDHTCYEAEYIHRDVQKRALAWLAEFMQRKR